MTEFGYILEEQLTGFEDDLSVVCERKRKVNDDSEIWGPIYFKKRAAIDGEENQEFCFELTNFMNPRQLDICVCNPGDGPGWRQKLLSHQYVDYI